MFDELAEVVHATAKEKGFWDHEVDDIFVTKQLMMIVSEAVEVMEAIRKDKDEEELAKEFADIFIRTLDLYAGLVEHGYTTISLDWAMQEKMLINKDRPEKHGVRF
jgi:NTP pyrophosphatase (non-canonical NTP hydrolase)